MLMLPRLLLLALLLAAPLCAQSIVIRPLVVAAGDTTDHVDLAYKSQAAHAQATLVAVVYDAKGQRLTGQRITWASSDTTVAKTSGTSATGTVTARGFGSATITASIAGASATLVACVYGSAFPHGVAVIGPATVPIGATVQYVAATADSGVAIFPTCVHWTAADPSVATVDRHGRLTARAVSSARSLTAFIGVLP